VQRVEYVVPKASSLRCTRIPWYRSKPYIRRCKQSVHHADAGQHIEDGVWEWAALDDRNGLLVDGGSPITCDLTKSSDIQVEAPELYNSCHDS
jgi:hypothetical protein